MEDLQERIEELQGATSGSGEPEMVPDDQQQTESYEKKKP
jgi:hypothetical protein